MTNEVPRVSWVGRHIVNAIIGGLITILLAMGMQTFVMATTVTRLTTQMETVQGELLLLKTELTKASDSRYTADQAFRDLRHQAEINSSLNERVRSLERQVDKLGVPYVPSGD